TGKGPRIALLEVFIMRHHDQRICPLGKARVVVVGIGSRYGDEQPKRMRVKALRELRDEDQIVDVCRRWQLLKVEDETREAARHGVGQDLVDENGARVR